MFRAVRPTAPIAGRSVIVTDDGIATGSTMIVALQAI
jgi:predicted phosphoribosyltransferase